MSYGNLKLRKNFSGVLSPIFSFHHDFQMFKLLKSRSFWGLKALKTYDIILTKNAN